MSWWLKIGASVIGLMVCGLFVVLWVRSFFYFDRMSVPFPGVQRVYFISYAGQLNSNWSMRPRLKGSTWRIFVHSDKFDDTIGRPPFWKTLEFGAYRERPTIGLVIPYWFPMLLSGLAAAAPWMKWRFSIRAMLIATTIASVVLCGVVLWLRSKLD